MSERIPQAADRSEQGAEGAIGDLELPAEPPSGRSYDITDVEEADMDETARDRPEREDVETAAEPVGDLELPDGVDVSGGSLNTYISSVNGEKQGKPKP